MATFCYARVANQECLSEASQKELAKTYAEKQGFKVVNTGNSQLDVKILSLLTTQQAQLNEAVVTFKD